VYTYIYAKRSYFSLIHFNSQELTLQSYKNISEKCVRLTNLA